MRFKLLGHSGLRVSEICLGAMTFGDGAGWTATKEESRRIFGEDFWAYGLEANRPSWDALCRYVHEQGLAPRRIAPEELFVPVGDL